MVPHQTTPDPPEPPVDAVPTTMVVETNPLLREGEWPPGPEVDGRGHDLALALGLDVHPPLALATHGQDLALLLLRVDLALHLELDLRLLDRAWSLGRASACSSLYCNWKPYGSECLLALPGSDLSLQLGSDLSLQWIGMGGQQGDTHNIREPTHGHDSLKRRIALSTATNRSSNEFLKR